MASTTTLALASAGLSAAQAFAGARAQSRAQSQALNNQAARQRQLADRQRQIADLQEAQLRRQRSREEARLRNSLASTGRDAGTGSALLFQQNLTAENEFDALISRASGHARAQPFENDARRLSYRANSLRGAGFRTAANSLLRGP